MSVLIICKARNESLIVLRLRPDNYSAAMLLGKSLYMSESYDQSSRYFTKLNEVKPDDLEILLYLGLSQMAVEDYSSAQKTLEKDTCHVRRTFYSPGGAGEYPS